MSTQTITLTEYEPRRLGRAALDEATGTLLWRHYDAGRGVVSVEFPSPRHDDEWQLTAQGWVGHIPLTPMLSLSLQPRVPLSNLFRMLEVAHDLPAFQPVPGVVQTEALRDLYERLAEQLARGVLARARQGFYQAYLERDERLPYVRGRIDTAARAREPWAPAVRCHHEEATGNVADNQILAWTLRQVARSGLCGERVQPLVRRAYRALDGVAALSPVTAADCLARLYHRLNEDYRPLHALCRFFLEHSGPGHRSGDRTMLPFLVNMPRLYERFVAEWLRAHLPAPWSLRIQEQVDVGHEPGALHFDVDLVLYDGDGLARTVLDTKYKSPAAPETADVAQVVAYAGSKGCREAILVYPTPLARPLEAQVGDVRVRALHFDLSGDLQQAGAAFLQALGNQGSEG